MEILIVVGAILLVIFFAAISKSGKDKLKASEDLERSKNEAFYQKVINSEPNENTREIFKRAKKMFDDWKMCDFLDVYVHSGMPKEIAYSQDIDRINRFLDFNSKKADHLFGQYVFALSKRYELNFNELPIIDNVFDRYKLVLNQGEVLYEMFNNIFILQEKTVRKNVVYSGVRFNSGVMRAGTLSYSSNDIKDIVILDCGRLFVTNKRVIFVGKQKNVSENITITSIIDYYLYKDGILICRNNRKNVLFIEAQNKNYNQPDDDYYYNLNDFPFRFISVVKRIVNRNENCKLG